MDKIKKLRAMVFLARAGSILALVGIPVAMAILWGIWAGVAGTLILLPTVAVILFWTTVIRAFLRRAPNDR